MGKRGRLTKNARDNLIGYGLILPSLVVLFAIGIVPILITVSYSFQYKVLTDPLSTHFVGLENYITLFKNNIFMESLKNTMIFAILSIAFQMAIGLAGALLMSNARRGVGLVRTAILIPWAIPGIIVAYMFSFMFNDSLGVINQLLQTVGLIDAPVAWLTNRGTAMLAVVLADTWKQFPYVALMLLAGLQTIPGELYESAKVDGAGRFRIF